MMKVILKIGAMLVLVALPALAVQGDSERENLGELLQQLGSETYPERGQAMEGLWMMGDGALPVLEKLTEDDDPEIRARAVELRRQILSGILPDTPPEIAAILKRFNHAKGDRRLRVFNELFRKKAFDYLFRLMRIEEDTELLGKMENQMERYMPFIARFYLKKGEWEKARAYLQKWHSPANDRNLAALLQTHDLLDAALGRLSASEKPRDRERYLAFLQVKGDAQAVFDEASAQGNTVVRDVAAILLGNPRPALRSGLEDKNVNHRRYLKIAIARLEGDQATATATRAELLEVAKTNGELKRQARSVFYRLGNLQDVKHLSQDDISARMDYYFAMEKPRKALAAAGMTGVRPVGGWLEKKCAKMAKRGFDTGRNPTSLELKRLAAFYDRHGEVATSARIIEAYAKAFTGEKREKYLTTFLSNFPLYAPRGFCVAMGRLYEGENAEEGARILDGIIQNYGNDNESLGWVLEKIRDLKPDMAMEDQIRLSMACAADFSYVDLERRDALLDELETAAVAEGKKGDFGALQKLMRLAILRNDSESLLRIGKDLKKAGELKNWSYALTLNHAYRGDWPAAYDEWEDFLAKDEGYQSWPPYLYLSGLLLDRAGRQEDAAKSYRRAGELGLNATSYRAAVLNYLENFGGNGEEYALLKRHLLSEAAEVASGGGDLDVLFQQATEKHDWAVAEAAGEVLLARVGMDSDGLKVLQIRYGTEMARGFRLKEAGKNKEAAHVLEAAYDLLPGSGLHADELFPQLRAHGMLALHDRLFAKSYRRVGEVLAAFPKGDNDKNTAAWLAARALLNLDEAERLVGGALEILPTNSAYLDTMAEVHFARGEREKALEWSRKALHSEISDSTLRGQFKRYKNGPLPSREPAGGKQ